MLLAILMCLGLWIPSPAAAQNVAAAAPTGETNTSPIEVSTATPSVADSQSGAQLLEEEEEAQLTARDEKPPDEIAGGALTNEHLTYIVIALAAAVIVLIAK